ncbi:MAG TPA: hypothetical protein VKT82_35110 [Ktedonobacterales bacterium]|nr:hypothetical protein [Ktedonobacterales bacterium]
MQKWEYCVLILVNAGVGSVIYYHLTGESAERTDNTTLRLAELGDQGWELVTILPGDQMLFYFKRPLPY